MNRLLAAGIVLTVAGIAGYGAGVATPYSGRAFSVTVLMIGITLIGVHRADGGTPG